MKVPLVNARSPNKLLQAFCIRIRATYIPYILIVVTNLTVGDPLMAISLHFPHYYLKCLQQFVVLIKITFIATMSRRMSIMSRKRIFSSLIDNRFLFFIVCLNQKYGRSLQYFA